MFKEILTGWMEMVKLLSDVLLLFVSPLKFVYRRFNPKTQNGVVL